MSSEQIPSALSAFVTHQQRAAGEILFVEGDEPEGIYIVESGTVDLFFASRHGAVKPLRSVAAGQILGLSALVMAGTHDSSAITRTDCSVSFIARDDFLNALDADPAVWFSVLSILSRHVNDAYDEMRWRSSRTLSHALAQ